MFLSFSNRLNSLGMAAIAAFLMLTGTAMTAAESFFENCNRRPTSTGWFLLGDRNRAAWNESGWLDICPGKKVTRTFRQLNAPLKPGSKFFFEFDVMAVAGSTINQLYYGLMTPEGDQFNNFIGVYCKGNTFAAAAVKRDGKGEMVAGQAKPIGTPFIVRVVGQYDGQAKISVKVLDLLRNKQELSSSEVMIGTDEVSFSMMTVFGIGIGGNKTENTTQARVDNLYFSTESPNPNSPTPTFLETEMVKIVSITPIAGIKSLKIVAEVDSLVDADVELKGAVLPEKQLKGDEIWVGSLGVAKLMRGVRSTIEYQVDNIEAAMPWSPANPKLYNFTLTGIYKGKNICNDSVRFGFRTFETNNGSFYLNGRQIFLRGSSLNPPAPGVLENIGQKPAFIRDYLRDLKLRNVNIIRMQSQNYEELKRWIDACDELGIMVFQGCYGIPPGGTETAPPKDKDITSATKVYSDKYFKNFARHPSVVIYILANEVGRSGNDRAAYDAWLGRVCKKFKKLNPSVAFMANSGVESCTAGDIADNHFFAGWYYGSFLDYLNFRTNRENLEGKGRPLTLSECVGAFTTEKNGFPVRDRQIAAGLNWGGNDAANAKAAMRYQAFLTKQSIEQFRRLREYNSRLAGIMPFTVLYSNWQRVRIFSDMKPKPAADQMRVSFQPILLSWESWTPHNYVGKDFNATVHIINDSDTGDELARAVINWELADNTGTVVAGNKIDVPLVKYYQSKSFPVTFKINSKLEPGAYRLRGDLKWGGKLISSNETMIYIANDKWVAKDQADNSAVRVYDPSGKLKTALAKLNIRFAEVMNFNSLRDGNVLVLGDVEVAAIAAEKDSIRKFIADGGRVVVLFPKDELMDFLGISNRVKIVPFESKDGVFINQASDDEALFKNLPESAMFYWSDYTGWNESKSDMPKVSPVTTCMVLKDQNAIDKVAVLANFGRGLNNLALVEVFEGSGSVIVSGFDFIPRIALDPVADRFLMNLVTYACSKKKHFRFQSVGANIEWGDGKTDRGIVANPLSGLVLNGVRTGRIESPISPEYIGRGRLLGGPYRFNSNGEIFYYDAADVAVKAVFGVRIAKEWSQMVTVVRNPFPVREELFVQINQNAPRIFKLAPSADTTVSSLLPESKSTEIKVLFKGRRGLILASTHFE